MPLITRLAPDQEARFPEFVKKWIAIGLSTAPADRERAERAIRGLYALAKLKEPQMIWLPCPMSAALSVIAYAHVMAKRHLASGETSRTHDDISSAVRSAVGSAVDSAVRSAVDSAVRSAVDWAVRSAVRSAVDSAVGSAVDWAVRSAVRSAAWWYWGGSLWAGYAAWADYMNEVLGVAIDRNYLETVESCGYYWILDQICFASERPTQINLDDRGRLHSETGQSIGYSSGWGLYHWHGVRVDADTILRPDKITVKRIDKEANAEVRRVMVERFGTSRFIRESGAKIIDKDHDILGKPRHLWRRELPDDEPIVMVEVINSTPEPDGEFRRYFLRVPPAMETCQQAIAWTFGKDNPKAYRTQMET